MLGYILYSSNGSLVARSIDKIMQLKDDRLIRQSTKYAGGERADLTLSR